MHVLNASPSADVLAALPAAPERTVGVGNADLVELCARPREPLRLVRRESDQRLGVAPPPPAPLPPGFAACGYLPPLYPEWLGSAAFLDAHGVRFAYVAGEMARGIATVEMVVAVARAGMLGFFGAAGLPLAAVAEAIARLQAELPGDGLAWGVNVIHAPDTAGREDALVDLLLERGVRRVSASAFMQLHPAIVRYAFRGVRRRADGRIHRPNCVFAKVSRAEVAQHFMSPPPAAMLAALVAAGGLDAMEAELAQALPVAQDITAEADSGGHTDNRPLGALLPSLFALRRRIQLQHPFMPASRIGAAGGIGTPEAVAGAFAMGADYVVTGSVNQAAVESGLAPAARQMLVGAGVADMAMAPAADMFEMGVKVQVLRRGTLFAARATRLYELYRAYSSLDALPAETRAQLERDVFRQPLADVLTQTRAFFAAHNPGELARAASDPRQEMALVFRWYLGLSSRWPITGEANRQADYQIWCGPAMGAFNAWAAGSFLAEAANRTVVQIALNLLEGATRLLRAQQLRSAGLDVPPDALTYVARPLA